ncbi:MAG: B12-binding domain-containing radical SAM protein [Oscillospiraceae bacterium]|nr:B12-binding domain-containing radical SAM protein [Oscillospiraceae bacterium]
MRYEGSIFRPPSEAYSLIVQVTIGCAHNGCTFCTMYKDKKFRLRPFEEIAEDLQYARRNSRAVERIFLADGDALCMSTDKVMRILGEIRALFPECKRVGIYGRSANILSKSEEELAALCAAGLGIVYIGAESGCDEVLKRINKGETSADITKAVKKAENAGIKTSVTFISGLGGRELGREHGIKTGEMIGEMGASYVGLLTLMLSPDAQISVEIDQGRFELLTPLETMEELELILGHAQCRTPTVFRSNHASNYLSLGGTLPQDTDALLTQIAQAKGDESSFKAEGLRRL